MRPALDKDVQLIDASSGQRLEEQVHGRLLAHIRDGSYAPGSRLPSELDLAREYGVSRPVVRSALARLREEGLIISRQGAGSFVASSEHDHEAGFGPLGSIDDISQYFQYRKLIEGECVAGAARNADKAAIDELHEILADMDKLIETETLTIEADIKFHLRIAELSDNRFLVDSVAMLRPHMVFIGKFVRRLGRDGYRRGKQDMCLEHRNILAAIELQDPNSATASMIQHLAASERRIFKGQ